MRGKTLRGSRHPDGGGALHVVSAYATAAGLVAGLSRWLFVPLRGSANRSKRPASSPCAGAARGRRKIQRDHSDSPAPRHARHKMGNRLDRCDGNAKGDRRADCRERRRLCPRLERQPGEPPRRCEAHLRRSGPGPQLVRAAGRDRRRPTRIEERLRRVADAGRLAERHPPQICTQTSLRQRGTVRARSRRSPKGASTKDPAREAARRGSSSPRSNRTPKALLDAVRSQSGAENNFHWCMDMIVDDDSCKAR